MGKLRVDVAESLRVTFVHCPVLLCSCWRFRFVFRVFRSLFTSHPPLLLFLHLRRSSLPVLVRLPQVWVRNQNSVLQHTFKIRMDDVSLNMTHNPE